MELHQVNHCWATINKEAKMFTLTLRGNVEHGGLPVINRHVAPGLNVSKSIDECADWEKEVVTVIGPLSYGDLVQLQAVINRELDKFDKIFPEEG